VTLGDFSQQANSYRRSRPTYPAALVELLIDDAGVVGETPWWTSALAPLGRRGLADICHEADAEFVQPFR